LWVYWERLVYRPDNTNAYCDDIEPEYLATYYTFTHNCSFR